MKQFAVTLVIEMLLYISSCMVNVYGTSS